MENRVYYGQYSLRHWVGLILNKNILLPDYQRYFVWEEKDVITLIETFKKKGFVPPITIGAYIEGEKSQNLILDGQQRLTSILLAHLGLFPDKNSFKINVDRLASDNDDGVGEEPDADEQDEILDWSFKKLTKKGKNKAQILEKIDTVKYKMVNFGLPNDFLDNNFLGFSYLVPQAAGIEAQQKYFSSVFRNINIQGKPLLAQESRASLYFLKKDFDQFFNPPFIKSFSVKNSNADTKADFVRFLSLLSQFAKEGGSSSIARGYKPRMETYYELYIYSVVGENTSTLFKDFTAIFPEGDYQSRFNRLADAISQLEIQKQFPSIIDMDTYLFGLIYMIAFEDKTINIAQKDTLKKELDDKIADFKRSDLHKRSPAALKYLKARMEESIDIYKKYIL